MRVVLAHHGYGGAIAGAETMVRAVSEHLVARGHQVLMVSVDGCAGVAGGAGDGCAGVAGGAGVEGGAGHGMPIVRLPPGDPSQLAALLPWHPDIVHVHDLAHAATAEAAAGLAGVLEVPLLVTPATEMSLWEDREKGIALCRRADAVLILTGGEEAALAAVGVSRGRLERVPQAPWLTGTPDPAGFRARHGLVGPMVLFCGRKARFKGYHLLLEAAPLVWRQYPEARMVFIGPRWDPDAAAVFARHADQRILELGVVDEHDKHSAMAACDLLCVPSTADVFPLVIAEAWACAKAVVAGSFAGEAGVIAHGVDGLVTDGQPAALAQAIVGLLGDPTRRAAMGTAGRDRAMSWDAVADRLEEIYLRVMGDQRCTR